MSFDPLFLIYHITYNGWWGKGFLYLFGSLFKTRNSVYKMGIVKRLATRHEQGPCDFGDMQKDEEGD
jgi:hypothetical protein